MPLARFAIIACLVSPAPVFAQQQKNQEMEERAHETTATTATTLPDMVVTATRSGTGVEDAPSLVRQLNAEKLAERQPRTLPEALRELPGVSIQKTSNGQGSPYIRGFTGFRNLLLIDGIRFNNSTFREGPNQYWNTIDQHALAKIELVPGQGSTLYGSDAIGGTVNLITKRSGFLEQPQGYFFNGLASVRGATAENSSMEHLEINVGEGGRWGLHAGATVSQFGDVYAASLGNQLYTGYDQWAYDLRLDVALDPNWTFTAAHQQLRQNDVWRTHATIYGRSWEGTTIGSDLRRSYDQERSLSYLRLDGRDLPGFIEAASFTISLQTANEYEHRTRRPADNRTDFGSVEVSTLGFDLQLRSVTPIGRLTYGVDYFHDWVNSGSDRYRRNPPGQLVSHAIQGAVGDDSSYDLLGVYLLDEIDLGERVHLFLGGRYTHAAAEVGRFQNPTTGLPDSYSDAWNDFSASARLLVDLDDREQFKLFAGISEGFRAPNLSDLSRLDIALSGELEIPSTGLEPEEFVNFEMGIKVETKRFSGSLTNFYTLIDNMIIRRPTGAFVGPNRVVQKQNGGDGYVLGFEVAGTYRFDEHWSIFGHLTYVEGKVDQYPNSTSPLRAEPLAKTVPLIGYGGIRWQSSGARKKWAELTCLAYARAEKLSSSDQRDTQRIPTGGTPGFTLLTLRGGMDLSENITLTASLDNLLDVDYRYHGSGSNEPGFGATAGLTIRF
jgi:hemoglobin/transferrin/lactoferrin receptor protein